MDQLCNNSTGLTELQRDDFLNKIRIVFYGKKFNKCNRKGVDQLGRQIRKLIPVMNHDDIVFLCNNIVLNFTQVPPKNHTDLSLFMSNIYGTIYRGQLNEIESTECIQTNFFDWSNNQLFMDCLLYEFNRMNHSYGSLMCHEMIAHRYGDMAIKVDQKHISQMLFHYESSHDLAVKLPSIKHAFSSMHWAGYYLYALSSPLSDEYHKRSLEMMLNFSTIDAPKAVTSLFQIEKTNPKMFEELKYDWDFLIVDRDLLTPTGMLLNPEIKKNVKKKFIKRISS